MAWQGLQKGTLGEGMSPKGLPHRADCLHLLFALHATLHGSPQLLHAFVAAFVHMRKKQTGTHMRTQLTGTHVNVHAADVTSEQAQMRMGTLKGT